MLRWVDAEPRATAALTGMADEIGPDWRTRLGDAVWAQSNHVAQCLLIGLGIAVWNSIAHAVTPPVAVAGYSVGELAAYAAAGVLDDVDAQRLAVLRAASMDLRVGSSNGGLLAVSRLAEPLIRSICRRFDLAVAIRNAPDHLIVGGKSAGLDAATREFARLGAECGRLPIAIASHTPQMNAAAADFAAVLSDFRLSDARIPVATCFRGAASRRADILRHDLAQQVCHTVQWQRCMETIAERRPECVLEVGPGTSLSRMWNAVYPNVPARSADEFQSGSAIAGWLRRLR